MSSLWWWRDAVSLYRKHYRQIDLSPFMHFVREWDSSGFCQFLAFVESEDSGFNFEKQVLLRCQLSSMVNPPIPFQEEIPLSDSQKRLALGASVLLSSGSIIAGGFVRDLLRGREWKDVDIFEPSIGVQEVGTGLHVDRPYFLVDYVRTDATGFRGKPVQYVGVPCPWGNVRLFDAPCNMLVLDYNGKVWSMHPNAEDHALRDIYDPSPLQTSSPRRLQRFRELFGENGIAGRETIDDEIDYLLGRLDILG